MRALWEAAVATQLDDIVQLRRQAEAVKAAADASRHEAELRTELLRVELADVRSQLSICNAELAVARASATAATKQTTAFEEAASELQTQLTAVETAAAEAVRKHAGELATERVRYDGLSRQLLIETAHQRETFQTERQRLEAELARAAERLAALEALRERLITELAEERAARQQAAAEAAALTTVVEQQRQTLALVGTATAKKPVAGARRPHGSAARAAVTPRSSGRKPR
ncbi:transcriptional regulator [Paraburkholderia sp. EG286B]|uniref:transcriptional regulator n=1 Tax=Paraburkholderia sp. EG286B TaxID=3237011 RepID=UPI0034D221AA